MYKFKTMKKTTLIISLIYILFGCGTNKSVSKSDGKNIPMIDTNAIVETFDNRSYPTIAMQIFSFAEIYRMAGDYASAILEYQEALKYDDKSVTIYNSIGDAYLNLYKYEQAIEYYKKSLLIEFNQIELKNKLADIYLVTGNISKSIKIWKTILKENPRQYDIYYSLINAYIMNRDEVNARKYLKTYIQKGENELSILNNCVLIYKELGDYNEAIILTRKILTLSNESKYYDLLIELLFLNKQYTDVDKVVDNWIINSPNELSPYYYKISNYIAKSQIDSAKKYVNKIQSRWREEWWISNFQASIFMEENNSDSVDFYIERVFDIKEAPFLPYHNYALWLLNMRRYEDGISFIDSVIEKFPQNNDLQFIEALIYSELEELSKSIQIFQMLLDEDQNNKNILHNLAILYDQNSQVEKANETYSKIILIDSSDAIAYNNYSYLLAENGNELEKALSLSKKSLEIEPNSGVYFDTMAWVLFKMGNYKKALAVVDSAIILIEENNSELFYHKGEILFKLGDIENSKKNLRIALEIDPTFSRAKKRLEEISND
ncbi:MAG: tetratricopeptide repeat protein [Candidatus Marinimicrobia bacterium]|nr:tetratricopeptide repeat protein [Candidatus Neomarinimicrobiota bacterium]